MPLAGTAGGAYVERRGVPWRSPTPRGYASTPTSAAGPRSSRRCGTARGRCCRSTAATCTPPAGGIRTHRRRSRRRGGRAGGLAGRAAAAGGGAVRRPVAGHLWLGRGRDHRPLGALAPGGCGGQDGVARLRRWHARGRGRGPLRGAVARGGSPPAGPAAGVQGLEHRAGQAGPRRRGAVGPRLAPRRPQELGGGSVVPRRGRPRESEARARDVARPSLERLLSGHARLQRALRLLPRPAGRHRPVRGDARAPSGLGVGARRRIIHFCGGTTIHPDLAQLVAHVRASGARRRSPPTPSPFPTRCRRSFARRAPGSRSACPATASTTTDRRQGRLDETTPNLRRLLAAGVATSGQTTVVAGGAWVVDWVARFCLEAGVRRLSVLPFIPRGSGYGRRDEYGFSAPERPALHDRVVAKRRALGAGWTCAGWTSRRGPSTRWNRTAGWCWKARRKRWTGCSAASRSAGRPGRPWTPLSSALPVLPVPA